MKMAHDAKVKREVAIKLHTREADFTRELKLLRFLKSDFVVSLLDAYQDNDSPPALILEAGTTNLAQFLAQGTLADVDRKHIFERICLAILFVHGKGIVVVDLKPHNIVLFGSLLDIKLIDFESVRKVTGRATLCTPAQR